ncbi:MAG: TonB-dependent receptor [Opitutaceae bacterium]|jgi:iron complex outermembrane recepter protein|nr:TonB-dependent receptor [Opitutaceae bacterium]
MPAGLVGFAFGADARQETLDQYPDLSGLSGDIIGSSTAATTNAQRKIAGFFAEAQLPLLSGVEGAHVLSADLAVRHEKFFTSDVDTTVPKIGLRWQPLDETLTLRASWSEGFREPSLYERYATPTASLTAVTDPRDGSREPEQDVTFAGNRRLAPEETSYTNIGFVWSPNNDTLRGLTLGVDYWDITREGTVESSAQDTVNRFFGVDPDGAAAPGGLLPGESVALGANGSIFLVNSVFFNVGETDASGYDFSANYVLNTDNMGRFEFNGLATWLQSYDRVFTVGGAVNDLIGQDVTGTGDDFYIEWKGRFSVDWSFRDWSVYIGANYTGGYDDADYILPAFDILEYRGDDTWIFDAQVSYNFRGDYGRAGALLNDTKVTLGARNLFDQDPPFASALWGNSTGYPGFLYSPEGQFVYVSLNKKL